MPHTVIGGASGVWILCCFRCLGYFGFMFSVGCTDGLIVAICDLCCTL